MDESQVLVMALLAVIARVEVLEERERIQAERIDGLKHHVAALEILEREYRTRLAQYEAQYEADEAQYEAVEA